MAIDNSPRNRQQKALKRKERGRASNTRILIVTEGQTEKNYFEELRSTYRLSAIVVKASSGTAPKDVVGYAEKLYRNGIGTYGKREFDEVYIVFDKDEHQSYEIALDLADLLIKKERIKNSRFVFSAIPSNPCFEFWILLHFQDVSTLLHRDAIFKRVEKYIPEYKKGSKNIYRLTSDKINDAIKRANKINKNSDPKSKELPYTGIVDLVERLQKLTSSST